MEHRWKTYVKLTETYETPLKTRGSSMENRRKTEKPYEKGTDGTPMENRWKTDGNHMGNQWKQVEYRWKAGGNRQKTYGQPMENIWNTDGEPTDQTDGKHMEKRMEHR